MPRLRLAVVALIALLAPASSVAAQRSTPSLATPTNAASLGVPPKATANAASASRAMEPPVLDGRTDDPAWVNAQVIDQFLQYAPSEGAASRFRTEVRVTYDDRYLYVLARMYDPSPDSIISALSRRDVRTNSEQVKIVIDSYHDHKTAFQFATNPSPSSIEGGDDFHGRKIERLSSEQIWDSLITLAAGDPDKQPVRSLDDRIYVGNRPVLTGKKTMTQLSKEVLALKSDKDVRAYFSKFVSDVNSGGSSSDNSMMMAMNERRSYNKDAKVRASELPSPAPRDHFLYLFGASDREVVDAFSREPNVGQVLSLMNGFVQRELVNNSSAHLYKSLDGATTDKEKIRRLYIAILNRPPTVGEMTWMLDEVAKQGAAGYHNIVSALVMSSEFLFLQ